MRLARAAVQTDATCNAMLGNELSRITVLVEIFFSLMTNRQYRDRLVILYLEKRNIAPSPKRNDELAQKRKGIICLSAPERHRLSEFVSLFYCSPCTDCCFKIVGRKKIKHPLQVFLCSLRYTEPIAH